VSVGDHSIPSTHRTFGLIAKIYHQHTRNWMIEEVTLRLAKENASGELPNDAQRAV
jgi:hypothetical protein